MDDELDPEHDPDLAKLPRMSRSELAKFRDGDKIYVGVARRVFDVSRGRGFYGPGGPYHVFAGRDATRALAVGSTTEADVLARPGDTSGLTTGQQMKLEDWLATFEQKYPVVAVLPRIQDDALNPPKSKL